MDCSCCAAPRCLPLPLAAAGFSCVVRCSSSRIAANRSPRSVKISAAKHFSSRSKSQQQMLGPNMFVAQPLGLFGRIGKHALALVRERKIDRSRNLFAHDGALFNLFANGFY